MSLTTKADAWRVTSLESEVRELRQKKERLEHIVGSMRTDQQTMKKGMRQLIEYLTEKDGEDKYNILQTIKQYF